MNFLNVQSLVLNGLKKQLYGIYHLVLVTPVQIKQRDRIKKGDSHPKVLGCSCETKPKESPNGKNITFQSNAESDSPR